jgi:2-oxoisovalerate dehydrogenase E1 component
MWVPPQTSTIASHVPKAVGMAFAIGRARRLGHRTGLAHDAIVCCSFGDASMNHATALAGVNTARYLKKVGAPCPILLVCEDNGIGISVESPKRWIEDVYEGASFLRYFRAEGEIDAIWDAAASAIDACRTGRAPVLLHLKCERLWGHAGSDVETTYHELAEIEAVEARDPLLRNARRLVETGAATPETLAAIVADTRARVFAAAEDAARRPKLVTRAEVMAPLAPWDEAKVRAEASRAVDPEKRRALFGDALPEHAKSPTKRTLGSHVASALHDAMLLRPEMLLFGEDTARKGGVYGATQGLQKKFGAARVFDTLLDETSILGLTQGLAHAGFLPVPEIQYLAYLHNALDQLRGEACSLSFFSNGQFQNPMVVRVQGLAYQKGFGGHFHNDDSIGALRDIPGLMIAIPSRGDDAARMLRGALAAARACGCVVVFLEPIALYHERDLFADGDGLWLSDYPAPPAFLLPGEVGVHGPTPTNEAKDLAMLTYGNGVRLSLRAARKLEQEDGVRARVVDLRWLAPMPFEAIRAHVEACGRALVVDECRATGGGIADAIVAHVAEAGSTARVRSVRAADSYVPLGSAASAVLVGEAEIVAAARSVLA